MVERPPLPGSSVVIDYTGVGRAVLDIFRTHTKLKGTVVPITITAGHAITREGDGWHVAKKHLAGTLQVLLQQGRLKVSDVPDRLALIKEMRSFKVKMNSKTGNESFEHWRQSEKDDTVLSVALACWFAERASRAMGAFRILPYGAKKVSGLEVVVCDRQQLADVVSVQPSLLFSFTDPGESPPELDHGLSKLLERADLSFLDGIPEEHKATWNICVPPYNKTFTELKFDMSHGKKFWAVVKRKRPTEEPSLLVFCDKGGGDRRALSAAIGFCESSGLSVASITVVGSDREVKGPASNPFVSDLIRSCRHMVC